MSTLDSPTTKLEQPSASPEAYNKLMASADVPPGSKPPAAPTASDTSVPTLPSLTIDGADPTNTHMPSGAMAVTKDLATGAWNEISQHPGQVAESFAIGAAIGGAAVALGPEAAIGATVAGGAYAAYQLYEHAGNWISAAKTVADPKDSTPTQVAQANTELQNVGAGGVVVGAGMAGAYVGGSLVGSVVGSIVDAPVAAANPLDTPAGLTGGDLPAAAAPAAVIPGDVPATPAPAAVPAAVIPSDAPPTPAPPVAPPPGADAPAQPAQPADTQPAEAAPKVNLDDPAANTDEATLATAFQNAIQAAKDSGQPTTFKVDNTVPLKDATGAPVKTTQAEVLYQQLQAAYPQNQFVFSKPDLSPGDPGYTESPAVPITQNDLHISSKENAITLSADTTLPDGTTLPAGSKFAVGTTYDGTNVQSALPDGKVWATRPDGSFVQVAAEGQSTAIPPGDISSNPEETGQVVNSTTPEGVPNNIIIRSDAKAVDPDGKPLLDAFPIDQNTLQTSYKPGTQPGLYAPVAKSADHFKLPSNITVVANTQWGTSTASGNDNDYFMKSGFADAPEATAKNYSGPTKDPQSAAELARLRAEQGYPTA